MKLLNTRFLIAVLIAGLVLVGVVDRRFSGELLALLDQPTSEQILPSPSPTTVLGINTIASSSAELFSVTKVTDGDTIKVTINDKTETIRIVGINTPETVDPRKPVECFGQQASQKMKSLVEGKMVRLETDDTQSDRDRYQRLLRFVFLVDGTDVGLQMIKDGYAQESLYSSKPHKYRAAYIAAQSEAQTQQRGLWNPTACSQN